MNQSDTCGVERTNDDATTCKRSAVQFGYWDDPYLAAFVPRLVMTNSHYCRIINQLYENTLI